MHRVSVAMCTFNGGKHLGEQLESIADQTTLPYELIVSDDGSTDDTESVVKHFAKKVPFEVKFYRNETNLGSTKNFERCIQLCSGDMIALTDQDDRWVQTRLEKQLRVLDENPSLTCVFSNAALMDGASVLTGEDAWSRFLFTPDLQCAMSGGDAASVLLKLPVVTGATMMFRIGLRENAFPIPVSWVHDAWLAWICVLYGRLAFIGESLIHYRIHGSQQLGLSPTHGMAQVQSKGVSSWLLEKKQGQTRGYAHLAKGYSDLSEFADARQSGTPQLREVLRGKANFSSIALNLLSEPRLLRLFPALLHAKDYARFTPRGLFTIPFDAIL